MEAPNIKEKLSKIREGFQEGIVSKVYFDYDEAGNPLFMIMSTTSRSSYEGGQSPQLFSEEELSEMRNEQTQNNTEDTQNSTETTPKAHYLG